ncbi:hypothetical protein CN373_14140 [Bacillus cereus]|uniref:Uncharacterized protein n=1 Tax=Bacillus cereus TaxID=1396 RepID=A0AA44TE54_BACCE|nr:hypothetical protein CN373_14140 [Bacillus cereus]PFN07333.1 hypothetical protein COJ55_10870 [Bacillus cereus]PFR33038.1 hypothetical protein COK19_00495 [Bacillus cereus]PFR99599.1 hypothetical protein COK38_15360 [Bacillus cereus]
MFLHGMGQGKALTASTHGRMLSHLKREFFCFHIKIMVMKPKRALHSCSLCVFTWHGEKKGPDRIYAWLDALFHLKKKVFSCFP